MRSVGNTLAVVLGTALIAVSGVLNAAGGGEIVKADPSKHFHPEGKLPSEYTVELQNARPTRWRAGPQRPAHPQKIALEVGLSPAFLNNQAYVACRQYGLHQQSRLARRAKPVPDCADGPPAGSDG